MCFILWIIFFHFLGKKSSDYIFHFLEKKVQIIYFSLSWKKNIRIKYFSLSWKKKKFGLYIFHFFLKKIILRNIYFLAKDCEEIEIFGRYK